MTKTTTTTKRQRRPMITLTGTIADLRENDYVDTIGGGQFKRYRVGALAYKITPARNLAGFVEGYLITFMGDQGATGIQADCPVQFRRFAD